MPFTTAELTRRYVARKRGEYVEPAPDRTSRVESGQRFGRLTVVRELQVPSGQRRLVECVCDCGTTTTTRPSRLTAGRAQSCGCLRTVGSASHGLARHPLYRSWNAMMHRCEDPGSKSYRLYGGRGITVCAEWHDVTAFITWVEANLGPRPVGCTLDRIDNDGNYEPGNVQWATRSQQQRNKRPFRRSSTRGRS